VHAHAQAALGEAKRRRAAGDPGADDGDVDAAVVAALAAGWSRVFEPIRVQDVGR
jgi:hypothetical protein